MRLNLLPQEEKEKLARIRLNWSVVSYGSILVFIMVLFSLALYIIAVSIYSQQISLAKKLVLAFKSPETLILHKAEHNLKEFNRVLIKYSRITGQTRKYSAYLKSIAALVPEGVRLKTLYIDQREDKIVLTGKADLRQQVLELQKSIESSPLFQLIQAPIANLLEAENVDFSFSFKVRENG